MNPNVGQAVGASLLAGHDVELTVGRQFGPKRREQHVTALASKIATDEQQANRTVYWTRTRKVPPLHVDARRDHRYLAWVDTVVSDQRLLAPLVPRDQLLRQS